MFTKNQQVVVLNYGRPMLYTLIKPDYIKSIGPKFITTVQGYKVPLTRTSPWSLRAA
jgi:hypothetical protein